MEKNKRTLEAGYEVLLGQSAGLDFGKEPPRSKMAKSETVSADVNVAEMLAAFSQLKILRTGQAHLEVMYKLKKTFPLNKNSNSAAINRLINDPTDMVRKKEPQKSTSGIEEDTYFIRLGLYDWFPAISNKTLYTLTPYANQPFMISDSFDKSSPFDAAKFRSDRVHSAVEAFKEAGMRPTSHRVGSWVILKELGAGLKPNSYYARLAAMEFPIDLAIGIALYGNFGYEDFTMLKNLPHSYIKDLLEVAVV